MTEKANIVNSPVGMHHRPQLFDLQQVDHRNLMQMGASLEMHFMNIVHA
jgi:hypothetical protein